MPEKDPTTWTLATWTLGFMMAALGGFINWYGRVRRGHVKACDFFELIGEILTSGFVGMIVFMAMAAMEQPIGLCASAAGVGGHMGTRLLFVAKQILESKIRRFGGRQ